MKRLILLGALGAVGAAGALWLASPEQGPPAVSCELDRGPCQATLPDGTALVLEVSPRPLRAMQRLSFTVQVLRRQQPLEGLTAALQLEMPQMVMGPNRVALRPKAPGRYQGEGTLVRCPSGGLNWRAHFQATDSAGATLAARFLFRLEPQ
jgi:hypothetical protein